MSGYRVPTFNLSCSIWRAGNDVQANPPDVVSVCNLTNGRSGGRELQVGPLGTPVQAASVLIHMGQSLSLLLPKLTDIRGCQGGGALQGDAVECPSGSGRFYVAYWVDDVGKGFANEHREAILYQATLAWMVTFANPWNIPNWPYPTP